MGVPPRLTGHDYRATGLFSFGQDLLDLFDILDVDRTGASGAMCANGGGRGVH